jgi:hypothetical protein
MASGLGPVADLKRRLTMILNGVTPALMGRPAWLAVMCLAALALPLVPAPIRAEATPPAVDDPQAREPVLKGAQGKPMEFELRFADGQIIRAGGLTIRFGPAKPQEKPKPGAAGLEAELSRKLAEVDALKKKIAEIRGADGGPLGGGKGGPPVRILISGLAGKPEEMEAIKLRLREIFPDNARIEFDTKADGKPAGGPRPGVMRFRIGNGKGGTLLLVPVEPEKKPDPVAKQRTVHERIKALLREVESLRHELESGDPDVPRRR